MAGYSGTPLVQKLGIREGETVCLVDAPREFETTLGALPVRARTVRRLTGRRSFVHCFGSRRARLERRFPALERCLLPDGTLWVSWPKKSSGVATDVTEAVVRSLGLQHGLVDVKICAVDDVWSGLKFVYRKKDRAAAAARKGLEA